MLIMSSKKVPTAHCPVVLHPINWVGVGGDGGGWVKGRPRLEESLQSPEVGIGGSVVKDVNLSLAAVWMALRQIVMDHSKSISGI